MRAYILGNGHSLNKHDLEACRPSFGTNRITQIYVPDFYVGISKKLERYWADDCRKAIKEGSDVYVARRMAHLFEGANVIDVDYDAWWFKDGVYGAAGGSLFPMIQMAMQSYDELHILGCDGFRPWTDDNDVNHFVPDYWEGVSSTPSWEWLNEVHVRGHKIAEKECAEAGVKYVRIDRAWYEDTLDSTPRLPA